MGDGGTIMGGGVRGASKKGTIKMESECRGQGVETEGNMRHITNWIITECTAFVL